MTLKGDGMPEHEVTERDGKIEVTHNEDAALAASEATKAQNELVALVSTYFLSILMFTAPWIIVPSIWEMSPGWGILIGLCNLALWVLGIALFWFAAYMHLEDESMVDFLTELKDLLVGGLTYTPKSKR